MSLVSEPGKVPKHMPEGGFIFDEDVAVIFDDMAHRSIPNYGTVHKIHTNIILPRYHTRHHKGEEFVVMDVGASTGKLFDSICESLHLNRTEQPPLLSGLAMDISEPMLHQLAQKVPWVMRYEHSIADPVIFGEMQQNIDVINMMYVLQFIPREERGAAIRNCYYLLKPGGILLLAQKETANEDIAPMMDHQYYNWRTSNGYTIEEISVKTKALADTMWTEPQDETIRRLSINGFVDIHETSRWMQFTSIMAAKPQKE